MSSSSTNNTKKTKNNNNGFDLTKYSPEDLVTLEKIIKGLTQNGVGNAASRRKRTDNYTVEEYLNNFKDERKITGVNLAELLPGPLSISPNDATLEMNIWKANQVSLRTGLFHRACVEMQDEAAKMHPALAKNPRAINMVVPNLIPSKDGKQIERKHVVFISNPDDYSRISKNHVQKYGDLAQTLGNGVLSTSDNAYWKKQRAHLNEVFLPKMSLSKVFPTSRKRALTCANRLKEMVENNTYVHGINIHEFFLHEAMAQLQLGLFGMDEEFMEETNKQIRDAISGTDGVGFANMVGPIFDMMLAVGKNDKYATASDVVSNGNNLSSVFGPLSKSVDDAGKQLGLPVSDQFGNMFVILFAGHDTTGHTMTWLTYELAKNPQYQERLHKEIDEFFEYLDGREMEYDDCSRLPFLTRCITEAMRLWGVVPSQTLRELQFDEYVTGKDGNPVRLPKGTPIQLQIWPKHHDPVLWGDDVEQFNPDREFKDDEIWGDDVFRAYNPGGDRFSPFTLQPRDCLGKNFAHLEMRTILAHVYRDFKFELSQPYKDYSIDKDGFLENSQGTMGPRDLTPEGLKSKGGRGPKMALYVHPKIRKKVRKMSKL